tara:strand:- start:9359 stop:9553 length:195 start_codon:yes stop_codon:yes gene_type:complete
MKKYKLLKDWKSKRHGSTIGAGAFVVIKLEKELNELIEGEYIVAPKIKKTKKKKEEKGSKEETN